MGTLESIQEIYNYEKGTIDEKLLSKKIMRFNEIYSQSELLKEMIIFPLVLDFKK